MSEAKAQKQDNREAPPARRGRRKRRAGRAEGSAQGVLDVYGTVVGTGPAVSTEQIKRSVFDALT